MGERTKEIQRFALTAFDSIIQVLKLAVPPNNPPDSSKDKPKLVLVHSRDSRKDRAKNRRE